MKIVLADDHALVREAMSAMLAAMPDVTLVVQCASFEETLAALEGPSRPALVIADLVMPGMDGLDGVARLVQASPGSPVVVLSGVDDPETCRAALSNGARGYICKSGNSDVFEAAIRLVLAGGTYLPPQLLETDRANAVQRAIAVQENGSLRTAGAPHVQVTARQRDVLRELAKGASNKDIARSLDLSPATVKAHVATILAVLGAQNRTEAVMRAGELGLL